MLLFHADAAGKYVSVYYILDKLRRCLSQVETIQTLSFSLTQGCFCAAGYTLQTMMPGTINEKKGCVPSVSGLDSRKAIIIGSVTAVSGAAIIVAIIVGLLCLLRVQIAAFTLQRAKKKGPPGTWTHLGLSISRYLHDPSTRVLVSSYCVLGKQRPL